MRYTFHHSTLAQLYCIHCARSTLAPERHCTHAHSQYLLTHTPAPRTDAAYDDSILDQKELKLRCASSSSSCSGLFVFIAINSILSFLSRVVIKLLHALFEYSISGRRQPSPIQAGSGITYCLSSSCCSKR